MSSLAWTNNYKLPKPLAMAIQPIEDKEKYPNGVYRIQMLVSNFMAYQSIAYEKGFTINHAVFFLRHGASTIQL